MDSISVNRIIGNVDNALRTATISASTQRGSTDIRQTSVSRQGRGRMNLTGSYTGASDTTVDVQVLGGSGSAMRASAPVVRGVGNGKMTISAIAPGAVAETLTFTLLDAGEPAVAATLDFYGVTLAAQIPGLPGNSLSLTVTRNLSEAPLSFATLEAINKGTVDFDGTQFDWGGPPTSDGNIPANAPRIRFEGFPQVFRQWKAWTGSVWSYHIDPMPEYEIPPETRILGVTGGYTLSLTDGNTLETYSAVTLYDFLTQISARSALITVQGVIAADRAPGGMAITDIPLRTDAHALPATSAIRSIYAEPIANVAAAANAPTELITIRCQGGAANSETWTVSGSVSGLLNGATTGTAYSNGPIAFEIPRIVAPRSAQARISGKATLAARTSSGAILPAICWSPLVLGSQASDKTITFTYKARPSSTCDCSTMTVGSISSKCLGLEGVTMTNINPDYLARLTAVYTWRDELVQANTNSGNNGWQVNVKIIGVNDTPCVQWAIGDTYGSSAMAQAFADTLAGTKVAISGSMPNLSATFTDSNGNTVFIQSSLNVSAQNWPECLPIDAPNSVLAVGSAIVEPINSGKVFNADTSDIDLVDAAIGIILPCLLDVIDNADAVTQWDTLWSSVRADMGTMAGGPYQASSVKYFARYRSQCDLIRLTAGILPKSDASTAAGDGCWHDDPTTAFWWVPDDTDYPPAFSNQIYVAAKKDGDGVWQSTQEFGFGLAIDCVDKLVDGDQFQIKISGTGGGASYVAGDQFVIPLVAAQAAAFSQGTDGSSVQTWTVRGSISGALPDWAWDPANPNDYVNGPARTQLAAGGIPFEVGDVISYQIEGGQLQWRRDGGTWQTADLYGAAIDLGDGLVLSAVPGAAPSFLPGDAWTFDALATHGPDRLRLPRIGKGFSWDGDTVVLDIDLGSVTACPILLIALHSLPVTAGVTISGGDVAIGEWSSNPAISNGPIVSFSAGRTGRYLRVLVTGAGTGAQIGWLYAGSGWQPTVGASSLELVRQYGLARGQGLNPAALYRGRGMGGNWRWSIDQGSALESDNADALIALVDHVAAEGIEPVCMVPDVREPGRAALVLIDTDLLTLSDRVNWQYQSNRLISVDLPLKAVLA
ncbi:hypothetical protein A9404_00520 [Halothiobacillus diazotrophicus]|uniref:Uncharacterized protein n=1 Tax=Halothiobacillus diazotrophicus TaxID=1860122 RepID=A0A191ZDX3_9GAMM|nr:hypothetical protein [Halothiobacillus diazotrophicus]ANJ66064.1 hypothetical protein A9404_00520 [Halothiobacillus diazotrophicus]